MRKYKKVEIVWEDCAGWSSWHNLEEAKKESVLLINSVGYLIHKDKKRLLIVNSLDNQEHPKCDNQLTIPRRVIKSIKELYEKQ